MPIDSTSLLKGLKKLLKTLDADLLKRAKDAGVDQGLHTAWQQEKAEGRTGAAFPLWRRQRCSQVSIAWVLSVVFVRTLEDRGFLTRRRIAGPGAEDSEKQLTALAPFLTARDYLLTVFRELAQLPGAAELFDAQHNPVWVLAPSAEGARQLLDFFRQADAEGELAYGFEGTDTRFLGDLYQNLSEDVRKRYALLQTPEFVEEFILEQTLDPAVRAFGLAEVRLIDPTCGSGHFLLGAFHRLFDAWQGEAPGEDRQVLAQRALQQVYGCDLNPYAVAIARFRLTLEFLQVSGIERMEQAPRLPLNLCVADSLLHGVSGQQQRLASGLEGEERGKWEAWGDQLFALEDEREALRVLGQRYHAVVGNPPYIKERDSAKRRLILSLYESAFAQFTLAAPFTERFFGLALHAGFVGMINSNAFTKRDFGKALVESVLPELELRKVIDASGAYVPGHGTPTLLLFGRNRSPGTEPLVAVLGKRGEPQEPADPATAPVWEEIASNHMNHGFDGRFISVEMIPRVEVGQHPWILAGGGARDLKQRLEGSASCRLQAKLADIGFSVIVGQDEIFLRPAELGSISKLPRIPMIVGDEIRDWALSSSHEILRPFSWPDLEVSAPDALLKHLWLWRRLLETRIVSGTSTMLDAGKAWFDVRRLARRKHNTPLSIAFAFVATHNHFVLDRGGKVFNRSAPIIKLKDGHTEDDHLALLGLLNSSVACFWMKMVFFDKGNGGYGGGIAAEAWERFFEHDGTKLKNFPVAEEGRTQRTHLVEELLKIIDKRQQATPQSVLQSINKEDSQATAASIRRSLDDARTMNERYSHHLIALQEELDWLAYCSYGLVDSDAIELADEAEFASLQLPGNHRPAEIFLAQQIEKGEVDSRYFERHGRTPTPEVPSSYEGRYRTRLRKRMDLINTNKSIRFLEQPEYKRRWPPVVWDAEVTESCCNWLLDRLESLFPSDTQPATQSARQLAAELHRDPKAQAVAEVYTGETAPDLERLVSDLLRADGVPYLAAHRYSTTGLEKHAVWRETWDKQRQEDAGEKVGKIDVPPKYATKDFRRPSYWTHRGKLDVPKERFVLYPNAETDGDDTPLAGWAGWDHLQRATALSALYQSRKTDEGWEAEPLIPLLAGLHELVPWLIQWHNEPDPAFGGQRLGHFFRDFVAGEVRFFGLSTADLEAWRPPQARRGKKKTRPPSVTSEALLDTLATLGAETAGEVTQANLATALGVASAAVGKVAKALVESGELEVTRGRPKTYRAATVPSDLFDNSAEGTS